MTYDHLVYQIGAYVVSHPDVLKQPPAALKSLIDQYQRSPCEVYPMHSGVVMDTPILVGVTGSTKPKLYPVSSGIDLEAVLGFIPPGSYRTGDEIPINAIHTSGPLGGFRSLQPGKSYYASEAHGRINARVPTKVGLWLMSCGVAASPHTLFVRFSDPVQIVSAR